jgi:hypothetical protein
MEVLILDKLLRPVEVVDVFESVIWTERFAEAGDCQIVTLSSPSNRRRFIAGAWMMITESDRVMEIQTVVERINADGKMILDIKGEDFVGILKRRLALYKEADLVYPVWYLEGLPADTMRWMFNEICIEGSVSPNDIIPFVFSGSLYPASTIPEPADVILWEQKPQSLFAAEKTLADIYDLGFRLYKDPNLSKLHFDVYAGSDRTTAQTTLTPVIFSSDMENLHDTEELIDKSGYFNVVHVMWIFKNSEDVDEVWDLYVHENEENPASGFDRRVVDMIITSIPEEITDIIAWLQKTGREKLAESRAIGAFDGEVSQTSQYVYNRDYYLGDLVEIRSDSGASGYMRVKEMIFAEDAQGQRSYPTFVTKDFTGAGTWDSWKYDVEWDEFPDSEVWDNQ